MLGAVDILIFVSLIALSLGIGLFHSRTGGRQRTTAEFIHGNHQLRLIPTLLSFIVSNHSAISVMYAPAEYYRWGSSMWFGTELIQCITILGMERLIVPMFYKLQITSIYEYLGLRFQNNAIQRFVSVYSTLGSAIYMGTCVLGPSVALETMLGVPVSAGIVLMVGCCAIYTSLGGMKAVIWTDVIQCGIMVIGLCTVFIGASQAVGGVSNVFKTGVEEGRLFYARYDIDPRTRVTVWSGIVDGVLTGTSMYGFDQSALQRFSSLPNLGLARLVMILLAPSIMIYISLCFFVGAAVFAFFAYHQCDPFQSGYIDSPHQLLPFFVQIHFGGSVWVRGLFLAVLYSASLSSVSTSLSGSAAILWQDLLKPLFPNTSEKKAALANRILVCVFAGVIAGFTFLATKMPGNLYQIMSILISSIVGPKVGIFLMACTSRRLEWLGAVTGLVLGSATTAWIALGSIYSPKITQPLPSLNTTGCSSFYNASSLLDNMTLLNVTKLEDVDEVMQPLYGIENLYAISFQWYRAIGVISTCIVAFLTSEITHLIKKKGIPRVNDKYMICIKDIIGCEGWSEICEKMTMREEHISTENKELHAETHFLE